MTFTPKPPNKIDPANAPTFQGQVVNEVPTTPASVCAVNRPVNKEAVPREPPTPSRSSVLGQTETQALEPREKMTVEKARLHAVLLVHDVADLIEVHPNWVYKNPSRIPGRLRELKGVIRFSSSAVLLWLAGELQSSGKTRP